MWYHIRELSALNRELALISSIDSIKFNQKSYVECLTLAQSPVSQKTVSLSQCNMPRLQNKALSYKD